MERYGKTPGPFKRSAETNKVMPGQWYNPVLEYLQNAKFLFTEKLDGTNMRLIYHPKHPTKHSAKLELRGRGDNAVVHPALLEWVKTLEINKFIEVFDQNQVCIYGEGIGAGIQKGGLRYGETHFRAFAIKGTQAFLPWHVADDICRKALGLLVSPVILEATLNEGITYMEKGFKTAIGPNPNKYMAEGLIGIPTVPLYYPDRERIIVKLKYSDLGNPSLYPDMAKVVEPTKVQSDNGGLKCTVNMEEIRRWREENG